MFKLNTERLTLIPLSFENYKLYIEDTNKLEEKLGLKVTNTEIEEPVKCAHRFMLNNFTKNENNYLWCTNWLIVLKEENRIIGGIMIKGEPNDFGEVVIGYGTDEAYQNKGYMTEVVKSLAKWIFENSKAVSIIADTDKENTPSHRVLEKSGFHKYKETVEISDDGEKEELIWWRLFKDYEDK